MNIMSKLKGSSSLDEAISQAVINVKSQPANSDLRMQLFNLYCLQADWNRALRQLDIVLKTGNDMQRQCELYKNLIFSERLREMVMIGERKAGNLGEELPQWCTLLNQANALYHTGDFAEGEHLRCKALDAASALTGKCEGLGEFDWLADGDDRLGPVCEFIYAGGYRWIPFSDIEVLNVEKPCHLTDLIWAPASLNVRGQIHKGYLPARYPLKQTSEINLQTGTLTEWQENEGGRYTGHGRKMWISSNGECSLFDAGEINH